MPRRGNASCRRELRQNRSSRSNAVSGFDATIAPADVVVELASDQVSLILKVIGTDDRITIPSTMNDGDYRIERVRFIAANGAITYWTHAELVARAIAPTDADQTLTGSYDANVISGGGGNDSLYGLGSNDTLIGGVGNDFLSGYEGSDTYQFSRGFGQDIVSDNGWRTSDSPDDIIEFDATIAPSDIEVEYGSDEVSLVLKLIGSEDRITIPNTIADQDYRIERVRFPLRLLAAEDAKRLVEGVTLGRHATGLPANERRGTR